MFYTQRISDEAIVPVGDFTGTGFSALPTTSELSIGVESRVTDATQLTSRYQIEQGINGPDAFAVIGVSTQLNLGRGFAARLASSAVSSSPAAATTTRAARSASATSDRSASRRRRATRRGTATDSPGC